MNDNTTIQYAGVWIRALAHLIDVLIIGVPVYFLSMAATIPFLKYMTGDVYPAMLLDALLRIGLAAIYFVVFLTSCWQATPGQRLLGVYLVRKNADSKTSVVQALLRHLVFILPVLIMVPTMISTTANMSAADQQLTQSINAKIQAHEPLTPEDRAEQFRLEKEHFFPIIVTFGFLLVYASANALTIGLTAEKTGFHDMVAKTRVLRGRPEKPVVA